MKRDLLKASNDYERMVEKLPNNQAAFYASDIMQIVNSCGGWRNIDPCNAITMALNAGFMVGYRFAKKQNEKQEG